jgi:hypothetical protein
MNVYLKMLVGFFIAVLQQHTAHATIADNSANFQIFSQSLTLCEQSATGCNPGGVTIETSSLSELNASLADIVGIFTVDGLIHNYSFDWKSNFPFQVNQLTSENFNPPSSSLWYQASVSQAKLLDLGNDSINIVNGASYFGFFSMDLGFDQSSGVSKDFRFEAIITTVPLPSTVWLFSSALVSIAASLSRQR